MDSRVNYLSKIVNRISNCRILRIHARGSNLLLVILWKNILKVSRVKLLIEVGANRGDISRWFCSMSTSHSAWTFEANPMVFNDYTSVTVPQNMHIFNLGMGSGKGAKFLNLKVPIKGRSKHSGNGSFLEQLIENDYEYFEVRMSSVDRILRENHLLEPFGFWIDVEGFTYEVLLGAINALKAGQAQYIFLELESRATWKSGADATLINDLLLKYGYTRIARDFEYPGQFNAIYTYNKADKINLILAFSYQIAEKIFLLISLLLLPFEVITKLVRRLFFKNLYEFTNK